MSVNTYCSHTPVFRPSKEEFSKPFCEYVSKLLKKHPDIPMFKVVPPEGWRPRRTPFPKLSKLEIHCPIKQMVFGTRGSYRCILMEQKPLTAADFKEVALEETRLPPNKERDKEDKHLERAFWSSVTINPPLYGADTPMSFFDEKLSYGWNLRDLGCLLKLPEVPHVPGVTTPMTYFGMWKSFFAWHVEDADLFSINYLHFGAPKVWYCVSPDQRSKFERMAQSLFPELHKHCHAFLRHKDILLSPSLLRTYGVEYMMAKQEPNEFIVLNAGAYHAGYNLGFNCAEAVNFAPQEWIDIGKQVKRCKCDALGDGVRISMRLFGCSSCSSSDNESDDSESEVVSSSPSQDKSGDSEADSSQDEADEQHVERSKRSRRPSSKPRGGDSSPAVGSKRGAGAVGATGSASKRSRRASAVAGNAVSPPASPKGPRQTKTSLAAAAAAAKMRRTHATAEARAKLAVQRSRVAKRSSGGGSSLVPKHACVINKADMLAESLQRAAAAAAAIRARAKAEAAAAALKGSQQQQQNSEDDQQQQQQPPVKQGQMAVKQEEPGFVLTRRRSSGTNNAVTPPSAAEDISATGPPAAAAAAAAPDSPRANKARLSGGGVLKQGFVFGKGGGEAGDDGPPTGLEQPQVIIGEDNGNKYFYMVQVIKGAKPQRRGRLVMHWLKEGRDGLFRPSNNTWEEVAGALVGVRTQWVPGKTGKPGGYRLLTLRSRILDTELVD